MRSGEADGGFRRYPTMPDATPSTHEAARSSEQDLAPARALAEPLVAAHGLELCDVEWTGGPQGRVLRVTIDRADGSGVSVEDCAAVSRDLATALDVEDPFLGSYHLEVSSPGLDRPLKTARDFSRQVGRLCKVKLVGPASDGQTVLRGTLKSAGEETFGIEVDGKMHEVRFDDVERARLVFELGGQGKPNKANRRKSRRR
jgi:ribosome maturation factor RimP